jgi:hypothetical protein
VRSRAAAAAAVALVALLAGCGNGVGGRATLWITRDRGAEVLKVTQVPAGLTAMQALERAARISTRYGGRYVQAIDGVEGSLASQHDWFYFINGYESDRSAAEYRLHRGDVEWWDFRSWRHAIHVPVVVGAFPEPFLHGWNGQKRPTYVVADHGRLPDARRLARTVHGQTATGTASLPSGVNVIVYRRGPSLVRISERDDAPGQPVTMILRTNGDPLTALRAARFRYSVPG